MVEEPDKVNVQLYVRNGYVFTSFYWNVPLNKDGKVVDHAKVSLEDYQNVMKYSWVKYLSDNNTYAIGSVNGESLRMHIFLLGRPQEGMCIDHIDHCGINNIRNNIWFATIIQNNQNRKKKEGTSSSYSGVCWNTRSNKWVAAAGGQQLGYFLDEKEAAKQYDTYVMLEFGPKAKTNELVSYNDIKHIDKKSLIPKKRQEGRKLPANISQTRNLYTVSISYKGKLFTSNHKILSDAVKMLENYKQTIEEIKQREIEAHFSKPIERNANGQAIIKIVNKNKEVIEEVVVSDDRWHDVTQFSWSKDVKKNNYMNNNKVYLHRYLTNAQKGQIADHVNDRTNDVSNHTNENLRIATGSENSHNKKKKSNGTSQYKGVSFFKIKKDSKKWRARVTKDGREYSGGYYETEIQAAKAYNAKAIELYGDHANLNVIEEVVQS